MKSRSLCALVAAAAIAGCESRATDPFQNPVTTGNLRFVSGVHGNVNVLVDGTPVLTNVGLGNYVGTDIAAGSHSVVIQKVGGLSGVARTVTFTTTGSAIIIATDSAGAPRSSVFLDTNSIVPANRTKLRVAHFAAGAVPITAWRTQPDFGTMTRVQFPFPYETPGVYMESDPGDWRVMISSEQNAAGSAPMPDTLSSTAMIPIAAGQSRTVVVVDGPTPGSVQMIVVDP